MNVSKVLSTFQAHLHWSHTRLGQMHIAKLDGILELAIVAPCAERVLRTVVAHGAGKVRAPRPDEARATACLVAMDDHLVCGELRVVLPGALGSPRAGAAEIVTIAKRLISCLCKFSFVAILSWSVTRHLGRRIKADIVLIELHDLGCFGLGRTDINILMASGATSRSIAPLILGGNTSITRSDCRRGRRDCRRCNRRLSTRWR